jgi:hypothetical protein
MENKFLISFALLTFVVSLVVFSLVVFSNNPISNYAENLITGFATDTGTVNITVESAAAINFTLDVLNFGSGRVNLGSTNATLDSSKNGASAASNVTNGNFSGNTAGLLLENVGNVNVTLKLGFQKNATSFLGGTSPSYAFNLTNNRTGSCVNTTGFLMNQFYEINQTALYNSSQDGVMMCDKFFFESTRDMLRIDIRLHLPSDSRTGSLGDIITATAYENTTN